MLLFRRKGWVRMESISILSLGSFLMMLRMKFLASGDTSTENGNVISSVN